MKIHITQCDSCKAERPTNVDATDQSYSDWRVMKINNAVGGQKLLSDYDLCGACVEKLQNTLGILHD